MGGGSMSFDRLFVAIELEQNKPAWVVDLLNDVEPNHAGLFPTVSGVRFSFRHELIQRIRLNLEIHQDSNHGKKFTTKAHKSNERERRKRAITRYPRSRSISAFSSLTLVE
jgi:hypothetical protein